MGAAELIACAEVRASKQWRTLRHQPHERCNPWLDTLEPRWHEPPSTLTAVPATVWDLRPPLTGGIPETIVARVHRGAHDRTQVACPRCRGMWRARERVCRTVETVVPWFQAERTCAWFQKKYRRLVVRWERIAVCFEAFLAVATL